jgi:hypothetical protein
MPSLIEHEAQYQHNIEFISTFYPSTKYLDWVVTLYFYAAVHLVEMLYASIGVHHKSHGMRNQRIATDHPGIAVEYMQLYLESRRVRYDCRLPPDEQHVNNLVQNNFLLIENYVKTRLAIP